MKKSVWIALVLMLVCIFSFSACDQGDTPPANDDVCQHTFGDWNTTKQATCKDEGELIRVCSKCSAEEKTTVSKTNVHTEVIDAAVSATCEEIGLTEGKHCSYCNKVIVEQTVIGELGHKFVTYVSNGNATTEADGTKTAHCENNGCNETDTITDVGSKLPADHTHSYTDTVTAPTCTEQGYTTHACSCGHNYIDTYTNATDHKFVNYVPDGNATTEADGTKTAHCENNGCNETDTITDVGSKLPSGHSEGLTFTTYRSGYAVSGIGTCTDTTIVIPSEYNGLPIIAILDGAFKSNQKILEVIIPDSVLLIEDGAFSYSKKLSKVELGNGVVEIGMSFAGCEGLTTIKIPASTTTIDTLAFYVAKNMESIEVDSSNNAYSSLDGILYNKDKTTLEYCPPKVTKADIVIPSTVTIISSYSFVDCVTVKTIVMSNGVQVIEDSAFSGCKNLESIVMSNNITEIQNYAFEECSSLKSCVVPNWVTWIYSYVFQNCTSLEWVYVSKNVERMGYDPFDGCDGLKTIYFGGMEEEWNAIRYSDSRPSYADITLTFKYDMPCNHEFVIDEARRPTCTLVGLTEGSHCKECDKIFIEQEVIDKLNHNFNSGICTTCRMEYPNGLELKLTEDKSAYVISKYRGNATEIVIPDNFDGLKIISIESRAFALCKNIKSIVIPDTITHIGSDAFNGCSSLTNATIGNGVTEIGSYAFAYCSLLKTVSIGENVKTIGEASFLSCTSLESIKIPNSVLIIEKSAFSSSSKLKHVSFGNQTKIIGNCAFRYCESLVNAILPNSVIEIGDEAFSGCKALVKVELGCNLKKIGMFGFDNCDSLLTVNYLGNINQWAEIEFYGNRANPIFYAKNLYINNNLVTEINLTTAKKISSYAFQNCSSINKVIMGDCVISIGDGAFEGCNALVNVQLSNNLIEVGSNSFGLCSKLVYNIENGLMYLGSYTNKHLYLDGTVNSDITQASINNNCKFIGAWAFSGCKLLTNLSIPNSVLSIGECAFQNCSNLATIYIPASVVTIDHYAFNGCSILTIDCEASVQPDGWNYNWNPSNCAVIWNAKQ